LQEWIERCVQPVYYSPELIQRNQGFVERADRLDVLSWLPNQDVQEIAHKGIMNKTVIPNPGQWITDLEEFKEWQNSRDSCGIWLRGALGTGKTVLTSTVVNHVSGLYRGKTSGAMAYFYCSGAANAKPSFSDILESILRQLVSTIEGLNKFKNWKIGRELRDLTNEAMEKLIREMIKLNASQTTTIIIDALDEADAGSWRYVIDFLESLINQDSSLVKVFCSSRPEEPIEIGLCFWPRIEVEPGRTRQDIETYIDTRVDKILNLRTTNKAKEGAFRSEVKAFLKERANGM
jgi:Cdc6-like AAA superfamily ATPase